MNKAFISVVSILIPLFIVIYFLGSRITELNQTIVNQQSQITDLQTQNKSLKTRLGNVEWNYGQDKKRYENRVETLIRNIEEIDKVNSDFEAYGNSRFAEGFVKAFFVSCSISGYSTQSCLANSAKMYQDKFWEIIDDENWDRIWAVIRGTRGSNF